MKKIRTQLQLFWQITCLVLLSFLLSHCDDGYKKALSSLKQPELTTEEIARLVLLDTSHSYSLAAATHDALQVAAELDAEDAKKGIKVKRTISGVLTASIPDTIQFPRTDRTGKNDPGFHVFNFNDKNGFAIISSDKRAFGRLGWASRGTIDNSENGRNMQLIVARMIDYIQKKRVEVESMRGDAAFKSLLTKLSEFKANGKSADSKKLNNGRTAYVPCQMIRVSSGLTNRVVDDCMGGCSLNQYAYQLSSSTSFNVSVEPLLKTAWNQNAPYNNYYGGSSCGYRYDDCRVNSNSNYYAGCVEIAESQVIAYFRGQQLGSPWYDIANTARACDLIPAQQDMVSSLVRQVYNNYYFTNSSCLGGPFNGTFTLPYPDNGICSAFGLTQGE